MIERVVITSSIEDQQFRLLDHQVYQNYVLQREDLKRRAIAHMNSDWDARAADELHRLQESIPVISETTDAIVMVKEHFISGRGKGYMQIGSVVLRQPAFTTAGDPVTRNVWTTPVFCIMPDKDIETYANFSLHHAAVVANLADAVRSDVNNGLLPDISDDLLRITTAI